MKIHTFYLRFAFWGGLLLTVCWLNACASPQQEQSLTQIQSQISVLSNEVRDAFQQSEEDLITLYKNLNSEVRLLQKNQADAVIVSDQLAASLAAIESKLDEYNSRMMKLSERLTSTETALTDRITSLSDQMSEIRSETTITPGSPPAQRPSDPISDPASGDSSQPLRPGEGVLDPQASQMYHDSYTRYVNGEFDSAIAGFQKYLEQYSDTDLADIAQFWIAESFFSLGEYETALGEYDKVISTYPESDKVSAAFFSKADAYLQLDRQIEAISHLKYVINQFPDSAAAREAQERLQSLGE